MKKLLLLFVVVVLGVNLKAQTTLHEAVDFTATDCHGEEINLFEILDRGQYVLIDFFYRNCTPCQAATPKLVESYQAFGCNQHDVFFMEISDRDNNAVCQEWCDTYGVEYPTIGKDGGGNAICDTYGIRAYPTIILIAPNREIVIRDLYPSNTFTIVSLIEQQGPQQHECGPVIEDPSIQIALGEVTETTVEASFTPNETCASYRTLIGTDSEIEELMQETQLSLEQLIQSRGIEYTEDATHTWTDLLHGTEYTVYALPMNADGTAFELVTQTVTTEMMEAGTSEIALQVTVYPETLSAVIEAIPNEETVEYHYGVIEKEESELIGIDSTLAMIREDGYPLSGPDEGEWLELTPNTYYYAIASGMNANGEWGETTIEEFIIIITSIESVDEMKYTIYPNPAKDYISISGAEIKTVVVYNALGQEVGNYTVNGQELNISTASFEAGVYYMSVNGGRASRFVVIH